jgi:tetratricopeptide (TPR) repeat protein
MAMSDHDAADALKQAQGALREGRFEEALRASELVLGEHPEDAEALYMAAVACRYAKRYDDAERYLARLHAVSPEFGRAWQEEGHLARAQGRVERALSAYDRACRYNPALEASWRAQMDLFASTGRPTEATAARAQAERLASLSPELIAVTHHLHEGRLLRAEEICRHYLRRNPKDIEAMRLLAAIGVKLGVLDDAEFLLESAVSFEPENIQLRLEYIDVLRRRQNFSSAREQAEALHARDPNNPLFQSHLAIESMQTGDFLRAFTLFDAVLAKLPGDPATLTSKGHALKTNGQQDEAIEAYRAAFTARPSHGDAWYALANLKTYRFSEDEVAAMREQAGQADLATMDRVHIAFALGKALEDRGEHEQSFRHYEEGNVLKRQQTRYDAAKMTAELERQTEYCTEELFEHHAGSGHDAPDLIFILGLPRAGSTLLEQILASHSQIDGTLELPNILALAHRLRGRKAGASAYPQVLHDLTDKQLAQFGRDYIENTSIHRQGAPFFIDKMPNNFRHIGLISLILPHAKIIDARRAPMDCCFSGFKQLFAEGQEFTYGLHEIGTYYADYISLMDHWDRVLPGKVLRVQHEDLLDDLEGQLARMLDFLGLPFEEACLEFHLTERAVRTASSEQVRRPINREGVGSWKPYEPWLGPLREALGSLD